MKWLIGLFVIFLLIPDTVYAKYDPLSVPNNKFGIHIVDPNDVGDAAALVNSTGGDWGYVTLVIQEDDRNTDKWQNVFNQMRRLHIIPIVRLATHIVGDSWSIPAKESAADWARFLNKLNWPVENRYVIIFNEPNHANEWGRQLDPEGYADILSEFTGELHNTSEDFFVLPAALDNSASSDGSALDEGLFLARMLAHDGHIFDDIDGWTAHAYPNPAFSGSPYAVGRGTLYSYRWEMSLLQQLGVTKNLPVFITETGWVHREGIGINYGQLSSEQVGNNLKIAAATAWQDQSIAAVTPFVLNYQGYPFDHFSWKRLGSSDFYPQYGLYQSVNKIAGLPKQREEFTFATRFIPRSLVAGSTYSLRGSVTNSGQSILSGEDGYAVKLTMNAIFTAFYDPVPILEPGQSGPLSLHLDTPTEPGTYAYELFLTHYGREISVEKGSVSIVPPPAVTLSVQFGWRTLNDVTGATVLVYDDKTLLHKINGVRFVHGQATITGLRNIIPDRTYRIVVLTPYYLPRQRVTHLTARTTHIAIPRMLPLDFSQDGALNISDILALIHLKPNFIFSLFFGP